MAREDELDYSTYPSHLRPPRPPLPLSPPRKSATPPLTLPDTIQAFRNGELTYPVQELTSARNLLTMVKNVTMVGNDLSFRFGGTAAPTILIAEATIGGE